MKHSISRIIMSALEKRQQRKKISLDTVRFNFKYSGQSNPQHHLQAVRELATAIHLGKTIQAETTDSLKKP